MPNIFFTRLKKMPTNLYHCPTLIFRTPTKNLKMPTKNLKMPTKNLKMPTKNVQKNTKQQIFQMPTKDQVPAEHVQLSLAAYISLALILTQYLQCTI